MITGSRGAVGTGPTRSRQPAAQGGHGHVERLGRPVPVLVPHLVHQVGATDGDAGPGGEGGEQVELLGTQAKLVVADQAAAGRKVDDEVAEPDRRRLADVAGPAAQVGPEAGQQHREAEGFDQVVVGARVEADDDVDLVAARREDDQHGIRPAGPDGPGQIDSVAVGQPQIQQDDPGSGLLDLDETRAGGAAPGGGIAVTLQAELQVPADDGVVLDDHHSRISGRIDRAGSLERRPAGVITIGARWHDDVSSRSGFHLRQLDLRSA